jgi:hypothetical protein
MYEKCFFSHCFLLCGPRGVHFTNAYQCVWAARVALGRRVHPKGPHCTLRVPCGGGRGCWCSQRWASRCRNFVPLLLGPGRGLRAFTLGLALGSTGDTCGIAADRLQRIGRTDTCGLDVGPLSHRELAAKCAAVYSNKHRFSYVPHSITQQLAAMATHLCPLCREHMLCPEEPLRHSRCVDTLYSQCGTAAVRHSR